MKATLMVRAEVEPSKKQAFDRWYEDEHLSDALKAFGADRAERGWDMTDPNVHVALYHFSDETAAQQRVSASLPALVAEFDRHWDGYVKRTRTFFTQSQEIVAN
jgi:hypothetical protein